MAENRGAIITTVYNVRRENICHYYSFLSEKKCTNKHTSFQLSYYINVYLIRNIYTLMHFAY